MTQSEPGTGSARRTVLIVDDDPGTLRVLSSGIGTTLDLFDVVTASDGREAIDVLERRSVDAIVTDLAMPVLDGFALIAHVTNLKRTLPVIVLSGLAASDIDERLARFGGLRVLHKPASYQDVAEVLIQTLERVDLGQVEGIPLSGVLQLVESERRSCTVVVGSGRRKGRLYFQSGRLINAFSEDFGADGEAAAYDILGWGDTTIAFEPLPDDTRKEIYTPMQLMLIEVAVTQDQLRARTERSIPPTAHPDGAPDMHRNEAAGATEAAAEHHGAEAGQLEVTMPPETPGSETAHHASAGHSDAASEQAVGAGASRDGVAVVASGTSDDAAPTDAAASGVAASEVEGAAGEAVAPPRPDTDVSGSTAPLGGGQSDTVAADPHVALLMDAITRLTERSREADAALAAVASEVEAFRQAQRAFDEAFERRERRRRELEAFRNDVASLAREILGRVDDMFPTDAGEGAREAAVGQPTAP